MNQQLANYLIKGGRLIDPASGKNSALDIRVIDGKIEAIGANLDLTVYPSSTSKTVSSPRA